MRAKRLLANGGQGGAGMGVSSCCPRSLWAGPRGTLSMVLFERGMAFFNLIATPPLGKEANTQLQKFLKFRTLECSSNKIPGQESRLDWNYQICICSFSNVVCILLLIENWESLKSDFIVRWVFWNTCWNRRLMKEECVFSFVVNNTLFEIYLWNLPLQTWGLSIDWMENFDTLKNKDTRLNQNWN